LHVASPLKDLALYGAFWMFGLAGPRLRALGAHVTPRARAGVAVGFALAAAVWLVARPAPLGIVNASPMAELLLGAAWIVGLTAVSGHVTAFARLAAPRRVIGAINRRAMTTYLWHCGAIALVHGALDALGVSGTLGTAALVVLVTVLTVALVSAAGPVEDLTAPRRGVTAGRARALVGLGAIPCVLVAVIVLPVGDVRNAEGAYVPASGRGLDRLIANETGAAKTRDEKWTQPDGAVTADELAALVDEWRERWDLSGVVVGVGRSDGVVWTGASGIDAETGEDMSATQRIAAHSITKSFTGALVTQLHVEGSLDLDATLASWVPEFPHAAWITLRQLAQHSSGLIDTGQPLEESLATAGSAPLLFTPGEGTNYSDSAYYLLAVAAERATGQRFEDLVTRRFLVPLGLDATALTTDRWAAGGMSSTVQDLVRWAPQFWGGRLGDEVAAQATALDPSSNFGVGTFGYCPCRGLGMLYRAELYGHLSAQGRLAWDPRDDVAVMIHTNEQNDGGRTLDAWTELDWLLRRQVRDRPIASLS
jgi:CubicO group peptidase (beta-lactamase class C family)